MAKKREQEQEELPREEAPVEKPDVEEQEEPERLSRKECAHRVIAGIDGDTTLSELAEEADKLFVAGRGGDSDYSDADTAAWHIQKELETLEGIGLVALRWECVIHPNVPKLGLPKNGK
ncbi:MAG TPA: hypothetical protein VH682_23020 [Gemmataceae bacterium]|jgi:hypothetical protein